MILEITDQYPYGTSKAADYADDLTAAGTVKGIKYWWGQLRKLGTKSRYSPETTKSWLILSVKFNAEDEVNIMCIGVSTSPLSCQALP